MKTPNIEEIFATNTPCSRRGLLREAGMLALGATGLLSLVSKASAKPAAWDNRFQLKVDFEINQPDGGRYYRPFVAVWIEDADTLSVRTLSLWVQQTPKGAKWIPDLKRWFRGEKERKVLGGGDLVKTISSATRMPGKYSLIWNGRDDDGKPVEQGQYTLCVEAAREHGTYQMIKTPLNIGTAPFSKTVDGNIEIKSVKFEYGKK